MTKTDHAAVLLDVGLNFGRSNPSPLQHNMAKLGVYLGDVDIIAISHRHLDHVGVLRWLRKGIFLPANVQPDLSGKRIVAPVPMEYPGNEPQIASHPIALAPGIATTGTIANRLFMGCEFASNWDPAFRTLRVLKWHGF